jgi:hypothetical protein
MLNLLTDTDLANINLSIANVSASLNVVITKGVTACNHPAMATFANVATANQFKFILSSNANVNPFITVTKNGLIEIYNLDYVVSGNALIFSSNCATGDEIYAWWQAP